MVEHICFLSFNTITIFEIFKQESRVNILKRAALLFDKIVFDLYAMGSSVIPSYRALNSSNKNVNFLGMLGANSMWEMEPATKTKEYFDIFLNPSDVFDNPQKIWRDSLEEEETLLDGENGDKYDEIVNKAIKRSLKGTEYEGNIAEYRARLEFLSSCLINDVAFYWRIRKMNSNYLGLVSDLHAMIFKLTQGKAIPNPESCLKALADVKGIDFSCLTWEDILILRKERFVGHFRNKLYEIAQSNGEKVRVANVSDFIDDALWSVLGKTIPNSTATMILGLLGNIPLPIPINPLSICTALKEIKNARNLEKEFGWLYFIQKMREKSHQRIRKRRP